MGQAPMVPPCKENRHRQATLEDMGPARLCQAQRVSEDICKPSPQMEPRDLLVISLPPPAHFRQPVTASTDSQGKAVSVQLKATNHMML